MTLDEAKAAMLQGKWVRRRWFAKHGDYWIIAHRCSIPAHWIDPGWADAEYFSIDLTFDNNCEFTPDGIGPTGFNEQDQTADDWELHDPPRPV